MLKKKAPSVESAFYFEVETLHATSLHLVSIRLINR